MALLSPEYLALLSAREVCDLSCQFRRFGLVRLAVDTSSVLGSQSQVDAHITGVNEFTQWRHEAVVLHMAEYLGIRQPGLFSDRFGVPVPLVESCAGVNDIFLVKILANQVLRQ